MLLTQPITQYVVPMVLSPWPRIMSPQPRMLYPWSITEYCPHGIECCPHGVECCPHGLEHRTQSTWSTFLNEVSPQNHWLFNFNPDYTRLSYSEVSSPRECSKHFTLHPLADMFIPTPTQLAFNYTMSHPTHSPEGSTDKLQTQYTWSGTELLLDLALS